MLLQVAFALGLTELPAVEEQTASKIEEEEEELRGTLCTKGRNRYGGDSELVRLDRRAEAVPKRSSRARANDVAEKGGAGIPVNSCTMARKFDVSVVRTVVGARREALDRFLELRVGLG